MKSYAALIFGFISTVSLICLAFGDFATISRLMVATTIGCLLLTLYFSLSRTAQSSIIWRISELPIPESLTPLRWLGLVILARYVLGAIAMVFQHSEWFGDLGFQFFFVPLVYAVVIVAAYWALVGTVRYFVSNDSVTTDSD